jgi:hypothetical protein
MNNPVTIVYVLGLSHSGSTLLDLLLGSHSQVTSIGEIKVLASKRRRLTRPLTQRHCTCGDRLHDCSFWQQVDARVRRQVEVSLWDIDGDSDDPDLFKAHNLAFFNAVSAVSGRRFVVDSSKSVKRLKKLIEAEVFDVRPVHLIRSPHGVVFSHIKKGRSWVHQARLYTSATMQARQLLSGRNHLVVRYETLATTPQQTLSEVMQWLGLSFEERQLDWAAHEHHQLAGNNMRFSKRSAVKLDLDWKQGLTPLQKLGIALITFPTRLPGTWLYQIGRAVTPFRKSRQPEKRTGSTAKNFETGSTSK